MGGLEACCVLLRMVSLPKMLPCAAYAFEPGVFYKAVVLDIGAHVQSPTIRLVVFDRADLQFSLFSAVRANGTVLTAGHMAGPASPSVDGMS